MLHVSRFSSFSSLAVLLIYVSSLLLQSTHDDLFPSLQSSAYFWCVSHLFVHRWAVIAGAPLLDCYTHLISTFFSFSPFPSLLLCIPTPVLLIANHSKECVTVSWIPEWLNQNHSNSGVRQTVHYWDDKYWRRGMMEAMQKNLSLSESVCVWVCVCEGCFLETHLTVYDWKSTQTCRLCPLTWTSPVCSAWPTSTINWWPGITFRYLHLSEHCFHVSW